MSRYIVPFYYVAISRLPTHMQQVSWPMLYHVPLFLVVCQISTASLPDLLPAFALALSVFYGVYEIGHIQNDVRTIRTEVDPTLRLDATRRDWLDRHFWAVAMGRVALAAVFFVCLWGFGRVRGLELHVDLFAFLIGVSALVFHLHNTVRGAANNLTFFSLMVLKYAAPVLLFTGWTPAGRDAAVVCTVMFPICRSLETASANYSLFGRKDFIHDPHRFRVFYYLAVFAGVLLARATGLDLAVLSLPASRSLLLGMSAYFLVYRLAAFVVSQQMPTD